MNIIIAGCGNVGYTLAEQLSSEGHEITLIDKSPERIQYVGDTLDVQSVSGSASNYDTLLEAGIERADLFIAVTDGDEINMLSCLMANKAGGCQTVARVRSPQYYEDIKHIKEELGLTMYVNPEKEAAYEISRLIQIPSALNVDSFDRGRINMIKFKIPKGTALDGMPVWDIRAKINANMLICVVRRDGKSTIPGGPVILRAEDEVSFITTNKNIYGIFKRMGITSKSISSVMIAGGGRISYYLASLLLKAKMKVKIIEKSMERCEELSELLPDAMIINGNAANKQLLMEEGINNTDAFVSLTERDEDNIILSLYASRSTKAKVITKVKKLTFEDIVRNLEIGAIVDPKSLVAEHILQFVRALKNSYGSNVETLYRLEDNTVEALEFNVSANNKRIAGKSIMSLNLKRDMLICAIKRGDRSFIPEGRDTIEIGDRVIVVTTNLGLNDIGDILED